MARTGDIIVGLDIGTTKVVALAAEVKDDGALEIIGLGQAPSTGLYKGAITEIETTAEAVKKAVAEAELMAGVEISTVYVGIAGHHIRGFNSHGITAVKGPEITPGDIQRVLEQAKAVAIPMDRQVLDTIVQEFIVDSQDGIRAPVGMSGVRLEAKVHIVTAAASAIQNIHRVCNKAGLSVAKVILEPLASAEAVLSDDERRLGVTLVDVGGGTSDLILFVRDSVQYTAVLPLGGEFITHDIAVGLNTPTAEAERIKQEAGVAIASMVEKGDSIRVPKVGSGEMKDVQRQVLCDIIEARIEEIVTLIHKEIAKTGLEDLMGAGVVLTGGTARLPHIDRLCEELFDMPVRTAVPQGMKGLSDLVKNPAYATAVGLVKIGARSVAEGALHGPGVMSRAGAWLRNLFGGLF